MPEPVLEVGKENPVNSKVCEVARLVMLMSEENGFALDGEFIDKVAAVLALEVAKVVVFLKSCNDVFKLFKLEVNSPKADIEHYFLLFFYLYDLFLVLFQLELNYLLFG